MSELEKIIGKKLENTLYPFFWQHGENHEVLGHYMEKISGSGMKGVCIEARPHPDFVGSGWWKDIDFLLSKAKELKMKMWILDDSHFPTGYANGKVKEAYPQYLKQYLDMRRYDVQGPFQGARIDFQLIKGKPWDKPDNSEKILGVYMAKRADEKNVEKTQWGYKDEIEANSLIDITNQMCMKDRLLKVDIPEGAYSIFVVYVTRKGGEDSTKDYLNPLVKEATQILIEEVYEPHYKHYKQEFGKTIQGFFSDEPRFGNQKGTESRIGCDMVLPWRPGLDQEFNFEGKYLPLLWVNAEGVERKIRFEYMDLVTRLYRDNFTKVLGEWCEKHNVMYLGHTIEDNGAHARLGYGTGHYFRGQQGMKMAGIDVIGGQIVPGMSYHHDAFNTGGSNGEFYHYALAKLASSAAHLDTEKNGKVMCEAFGAYGWNEGLKMMKWIADHLMVRGVNHLVPHAFSPKEFPDWDCPPHFYAQGHNPQFRYFEEFSNYVNRVCNLFKNGMYPAKVGVLYPAEFEWAGDYMPIEKPARVLTEFQIPFDIVTRDYLLTAEIEQQQYVINKTKFEVLIVPYGEYIPADLVEKINKMRNKNIQVIFLNEIPQYIIGGKKMWMNEWEKSVVPLQECGKALSKYQSLKPGNVCRDLVVGEYINNDRKIYMLFNENIGRPIDTEIQIEGQITELLQYDAFRDQIFQIHADNGSYKLHLEPYESVIWITNEDKIQCEEIEKKKLGEEISLNAEWNVKFADSESYPGKWKEVLLKKLECVENIPGWENKTGTLRYESTFRLEKVIGKKALADTTNIVLNLGEVFEVAEVFVNDKSAGCRICPPYEFNISRLLKQGENKIAIEVTNTLGTSQRNPMSHYLMIEPFGIRGPVKIQRKE